MQWGESGMGIRSSASFNLPRGVALDSAGSMALVVSVFDECEAMLQQRVATSSRLFLHPPRYPFQADTGSCHPPHRRDIRAA